MAKKKASPARKRLPRVVVEVTDEEKEIIERAANSDDRAVSNWAKRALLVAARKQLGEESKGE